MFHQLLLSRSLTRCSNRPPGLNSLHNRCSCSSCLATIPPSSSGLMTAAATTKLQAADMTARAGLLSCVGSHRRLSRATDQGGCPFLLQTDEGLLHSTRSSVLGLVLPLGMDSLACSKPPTQQRGEAAHNIFDRVTFFVLVEIKILRLWIMRIMLLSLAAGTEALCTWGRPAPMHCTADSASVVPLLTPKYSMAQ